jgi:hypothetical protein
MTTSLSLISTVSFGQRGLAYEKVGEKSKAEEDFARARKLGYADKR